MKTKQFLAALLSSAIVLGTMAVPVFAANVAKIGDTEYETLAAAFAAAQDGETITVLADCAGNGIKAPQGKFASGLTVDFGGYIYTVDGTTVGSAGTETNGFQLLKDNKITFKNGTITSAKAKILVQNYSNLTLDDMTLTMNNTSYSSAYTLSNNNGNVVIKDTTINANPVGGFAFDVCRYASYDGVTVTLEGNSTINGDIEVSASAVTDKTHTLNINGGTVKGQIKSDSSAANATININGGTIDNGEKIAIENYATLNITDGTIKGSTPVDNYGTTNVSGGTIIGSINGIWNNAAGNVINISGGEIAGDNCGVMVYEGSLTMTSGTIDSDNGFGVCNNGNLGKSTTMNISGGSITGNGASGIYHAGLGTLTVSGSPVITGAESGIEIRAGELNMTGGTVSSTAASFASDANGNGSTTTGAGIAVAQHTTKLAINVNISGGSVSGVEALYKGNPQNNSAEDIAKVNVKVSGGTFSTDPQAYLASGKSSVKDESKYKIISTDTTRNEITDAVVKTGDAVTIKSATVDNFYDQVTATMADLNDKITFKLKAVGGAYGDEGTTKDIILTDIKASGSGSMVCGLIITNIPDNVTVTTTIVE